MSTQKTPEQWFMQLKEPYRTEAIKGINKKVIGYKDYPKSLDNALYFCLYWDEEYNPTRDDWDVIYNSIIAGETTYLEPENVSLINEVNNSQVTEQQNKIESEKVELRPEDLVSGEVYTLVDVDKQKFTFSYDRKGEVRIYYREMFSHVVNEVFTFDYIDYSPYDKIYHATPEEVKLLLGEEQTDWEAKYNELKANYEKLSTYNDELTERINQSEPKGEKVYFCNTHKGYQFGGLDWAVKNSREQESIYEAICIGKKKSVLIDEL